MADTKKTYTKEQIEGINNNPQLKKIATKELGLELGEAKTNEDIKKLIIDSLGAPEGDSATDNAEGGDEDNSSEDNSELTETEQEADANAEEKQKAIEEEAAAQKKIDDAAKEKAEADAVKAEEKAKKGSYICVGQVRNNGEIFEKGSVYKGDKGAIPRLLEVNAIKKK